MRHILIAMFAVLFAGANGWACVVDDADTQSLIEEGWVFSADVGGQLPDTVVTIDYPWAEGGYDEPAYSGSALYIGEGATARYRFADEPVFGVLSMMIYDTGASGPAPEVLAGPKWGVQLNPVPNDIPGPAANDVVMGVELAWNGNLHYLFDPGAPAGQPGILPAEGDIPHRRVNGDLPAAPAVYDPANNVQGKWSRWTFSVHDGEDMQFTVSDLDGSDEQSWVIVPTLDSVFDTGFSTVGMNQIFLYGGLTDGSGVTDHVGLWVDEMEFVPDVGQGRCDWSEGFGLEYDCCEMYCRASYGDFNGDFEVGLIDLDILGQNWGRTDAAAYQGDANWDMEVGLLDLDIMGRYWGQTIPVPEPCGSTMLTVGASFLIRRRY